MTISLICRKLTVVISSEESSDVERLRKLIEKNLAAEPGFDPKEVHASDGIDAEAWARISEDREKWRKKSKSGPGIGR